MARRKPGKKIDQYEIRVEGQRFVVSLFVIRSPTGSYADARYAAECAQLGVGVGWNYANDNDDRFTTPEAAQKAVDALVRQNAGLSWTPNYHVTLVSRVAPAQGVPEEMPTSAERAGCRVEIDIDIDIVELAEAGADKVHRYKRTLPGAGRDSSKPDWPTVGVHGWSNLDDPSGRAVSSLVPATAENRAGLQRLVDAVARLRGRLRHLLDPVHIAATLAADPDGPDLLAAPQAPAAKKKK